MSDESMESTEGVESVSEETSSEEVSDTSETESVFEETAVEAEASTEPEYRLPEFDFGSWDGQVDALPEPYRPIHESLSGHLNKEMDSIRHSLEQDRELYQALLEGEDIGKDFRSKLEQAQKELSKYEKEKSSWEEEKSKLEQSVTQYEERISQVEAREKAEAEQWAINFRKENADVMDDPKSQEKFLQFLNSGIDPEIAIDFVRSNNPTYTNSALSYMAQGVPAHFAAKMAKADSGISETKAAKPRASAQMTAGATETANVPESAEKSVSDKAFGIQDARKLAVARAFKRRTG
jgi:myosin heavy subunit